MSVEGDGVAILSGMVREGITEMTLEQRSEGGERARRHAGTKEDYAKWNSKCRGPEAICTWLQGRRRSE